MSRLWVDIERVVLDGVALDPSRGNRIAALTQMALERLLRERGTAARLRSGEATPTPHTQPSQGPETKSPPSAEARWADELAQILYRAVDRSL